MDNSILGIQDARVGTKPAPAESPFVKAHGTMNFAQDLARRVLKLEERLIGQRPPEAGKTGDDNPAPGGTFNELRLHASLAFEDIDKAMQALDRLEKQLP